MYLQKIELQGFKSFANKIVFEFQNGITSIVGPNGSGKSNVADAVRWVLGEQSAKQLRGAKMEDVIFSGTQIRKPLGFAYVAITFDNTDHKLPIDYEQVTVARRVYRSGESEYLINSSQCRLKDVQELFFDTGIGKEGYSIIGQGQIDRIVSGKPDEKRELFDEAAGIVKYKKRKLEAEKSLNSEQQNLFRINDILEEREKQLTPLFKQSEVAKRYLKLRDELKTNDVNFFLLEYEKLKEQHEKISSSIHIVNKDLEETKKGYENTKEKYELLEQELNDYNTKIDNEKNLLNESKVKKEKLEGDIKVLKEQINSSELTSKQLNSQITVGQIEIKESHTEKEKYISGKEEVEKKLENQNLRFTQMQKKQDNVLMNIEFYTRETENCRIEKYKILEDNSNVKSNIQRFTTILEQNNIKKSELNQRLLKNKSDEAEQEAIINELNISLDDITKIIEEKNSLNENMMETSKVAQDKIKSLISTLDSKQLEFHREKSKLDTLKNITERYEGYGNSIKKIMERKDFDSGIIGVVADIIKTEPKYETAIEIALGGNIQNIVTDNEQTAKELIAFLKQNKYGRATFLPITSMVNKARFNNDKVFAEKGVIGLASNLVKTDEEFTGVIEYLLGRTIVVDDINNAIILAKRFNHTLRIVTLEGESISPGGSMSGGSYKNASNLLSRRREIEGYENRIYEIENEINQLNKLIEDEKQKRTQLKEELDNIRGLLQELYLKQNTANNNLSQAITKRDENQLEYNNIVKENQELDIQTKDLHKELEKHNISIQENEDKNKEIIDREKELATLLESENILEKQYTKELTDIKMDIGALEQSNKYILENIQRIEGTISKKEEECDKLKEKIAEIDILINKKQDDMKELDALVNTKENDIINMEESLKNLTSSKEDVTKNHKEFFDIREELSKRLNELDKETFRLNTQIEKTGEQMDVNINYMWDEYELTYISALQLKDDSFTNQSILKKRISELKEEIKTLGDVNVNAIEDYKSLQESYEFLRTQRDDLIKSEEALKDIIKELDTEMRKQFEEKFNNIQTQFDIVFKELFGGGKATLELMEDEDILESGIKIIAQPPGKKLQNMMQLSGGEKALTAISLLFAIQNLKPSPFCLLDEIEAALDDSNVKRFAKYLEKLTKETQFIMITHRRGTMMASDILYGVTMQEKGISTLVSVNLADWN